MNTLKIYWKMIQKTHGDKLLMGFVVFYLLDCLVLWLCDPSITSYGDACWLGFNIFTSIGLGDYTVTTLSARIAAVVLGIYGAVMEAYIPGLAASAYFDQMQKKKNSVLSSHAEELAGLETMSKAERRALSNTIHDENAADLPDAPAGRKSGINPEESRTGNVKKEGETR